MSSIVSNSRAVFIDLVAYSSYANVGGVTLLVDRLFSVAFWSACAHTCVRDNARTQTRTRPCAGTHTVVDIIITGDSCCSDIEIPRIFIDRLKTLTL